MARRVLSGIAGSLCLAALPCSGLYDPDRGVESARVYGNIDAYGYYFIDLVVGTPRQRVSVIIDTGSSIAAFPCAGCEKCGHHVDPAFNLAQSSTAQWVGCSGACQGGCEEDHCIYAQSYSEGSSIRGFWFEDEVQLGDSIQHNPAIRSQLGCHEVETNLFYNQKANGIMGIGPQRGTLLLDLFADRRHIHGPVFALCLAEWGGRLAVGGHNNSYHTGPMQYIPLDVNHGTYGVPLTSLTVEGRVLSRSLGSAMVDSGTTYTYMATEPYRALRGAIETYCNDGRCGKAHQLQSGACWYLPGRRADLQRFPRVEMTFQDVTVRWVPAGYMFRKGDSNTWCYSFQDDGPGTGTTLGASWMMHNEVVFDMEAGRLGVAPATCPEYRHRPEHSSVGVGLDGEEESAWGVLVSVEGLGATRVLRWWEYMPLALFMLLPVGMLALRCVHWRPGGHTRLTREPEVAGVVLGTKEEAPEAGEAPDLCVPCL